MLAEATVEISMTVPLRVVAVGQVPELPDEQADREVVEACLAGNRDAFAQVVRRHGPGVFALCARMVGPSVGEELAQEAFARAYTGLGSFRHDAQFKHWLYRIALNLCRDHLKSGRAREDATGSLEGTLEPADRHADPEERTLGREKVASLRRAIDRLSPKYREAFVLKHVENLSYEEMQDIVKMPVTALKVRVHRAREMLKKLMEEDAA